MRIIHSLWKRFSLWRNGGLVEAKAQADTCSICYERTFTKLLAHGHTVGYSHDYASAVTKSKSCFHT